jgi:hypothetical protein
MSSITLHLDRNHVTFYIRKLAPARGGNERLIALVNEKCRNACSRICGTVVH